MNENDLTPRRIPAQEKKKGPTHFYVEPFPKARSLRVGALGSVTPALPLVKNLRRYILSQHAQKHPALIVMDPLEVPSHLNPKNRRDAD